MEPRPAARAVGENRSPSRTWFDPGMKFLTNRHTACSMGVNVALDFERGLLVAGATLMHIPDGVLDPRVAVATGVVGAAGFGYAIHRLKRARTDRTTVLLGTTAAFVFAAQMVNFPVGPGVSGHLLGGVLAAALMGPWAGMLVIAAVLVVQCLLFGDGGLTALGANFINMGMIGAGGGYAIYATLKRMIAGPRGTLIAVMAAAWFSVILASGAFAVELAAGGRVEDFPRILTWMALIHAAIGVGEALITGAVVRFVLLRRPDLLEIAHDEPDADPARGRRATEAILAGLVVALAMAVFLAPFASEFPDGLEFVGGRLGFLRESPTVMPAPIPDYELKWPGIEHAKVATAMAGLVGTLVVFAVGWGMARALPAPPKRGVAADAA